MPNHVINELIFRDVDAERQSEILANLCNAKGEVDFEILVPTPKNVWMFNVSTLHEKTFKRTALDWAWENWGTKWNAYDHKPIDRSADTLILRFETAWSPPYPWLAAVFNTLKFRFEHNWMSEGGGEAIGLFDWPMDERNHAHRPWQEREPTDQERRHLHKLMYGVEEFEEEADS